MVYDALGFLLLSVRAVNDIFEELGEGGHTLPYSSSSMMTVMRSLECIVYASGDYQQPRSRSANLVGGDAFSRVIVTFEERID